MANLLQLTSSVNQQPGLSGFTPGSFVNPVRPDSSQSSSHASKGASKKGRLYIAPTDSNLIEMTRSIIPNRLVKGGEMTVSTVIRGRMDVEELEKGLGEALDRFQVRPKPVCSLRSVIYSELFDELIRQVTLERPERGLFLLRVRDEIRLTIQNHLEVFRSMSNYGSMKLGEAEVNYMELEDTIKEKKERREALKTRVEELERKLVHIENENSNNRIESMRVYDKYKSKLR
ncbi:hypothetical protein TL16_g05731 [Triparma laevis f. inornata]|uniref:Uncharacterized protein n=2 Tax=Triparma laevis TaxID=1534972 RepID=A0A9W7FHD9_9STRA|nr:hypothetical protein TL16_g05731 [Triparma laevis f. inornata]GMI12427.1 hypothetical protein TrLO_g2928 [Triparma laevis f. longispina]